jgi:Xaa-Pro aminopeptidase
MSHAPTAALDHRHRIVRNELVARSLDALVLTSLPNILYLTNFTGSTAIAVVTSARVHFLTDFRYVTAIADSKDTAHECPNLDLVTVEGSYDASLAALLAALNGPAASGPSMRIGFEAAHLTVSRHSWLVDALARHGSAHTLVATEGVIERIRVRKDDYEIATLREAARRLSRVAEQVIQGVRPGQSERDVAIAIDQRLRQAGFAKPAFDTIVAAGPNGALPHAKPGERRLTEGDLVVLDFGGVYDSYCVDLTRTVSVGRATARARDVYAAVLEAHDQAIAAVAPGRSRFDIDGAARQTLVSRGLGDAFGHGTGHGLGIEVHEDPRISRRRPDVDSDDAAVESRMVFTIEPGAYLPGWGGVRIEDDVLVTDAGVDVLTNVATDLIEV